MPLTDAYALRGVVHYGLSYGPLRLWGSAAFVVGALVCGVLVDVIAARNLIWVIAGTAAVGAMVSLALPPLEKSKTAPTATDSPIALLRDRGLSCHHRRLGADPEQPRCLLHLRLDRLAAIRFRWIDDCRPVGVRRNADRAVCALAAVHAAPGCIGADISLGCSGAAG